MQDKCDYKDCMCECELQHEPCRQTMCDWRKERLLKKEQDDKDNL